MALVPVESISDGTAVPTLHNAFWREGRNTPAELAPKAPAITNLADAVASAEDAVAGVKAISALFKEPEFIDKCRELKPDALAKTFMSLVKPIDELVRMVEFSRGNADSRQEVVGLSDLLQYLTDDEFNMVQMWVARGPKPS